MWCVCCNLETAQSECPVCGSKTVQDIPVQVYWCESCHTPIIEQGLSSPHGSCPRCGGTTSYMSSDVRPVFPEERLLMELLLGEQPHAFAQSAVWASASRLYVNGKPIKVPLALYKNADPLEVAQQLERYRIPDHEGMTDYIDRFAEANQSRLQSLTTETTEFVRDVSENFARENLVVSFSGGKDSTVVADIVACALGDPSLVHIFGDTTLEFPWTSEYVERFRRDHPLAIFQHARNNERDFMSVCEDIGPPARLMRWCCSMFKTGPISRALRGFYRDSQVLTFYGVRKTESVSRSKYRRVEDSPESVKIKQQTVASPIFTWTEADIWLYIASKKLDFNQAYRLGYDRVGCWCCPNNNARAQFLSAVYMPDESRNWRDFLLRFARRIGKPDPETYVDEGKWKARQGGNGLRAAQSAQIKYATCTTEDNARVYKLHKPYTDELVGLFRPFGNISDSLGQKLLHESVVTDRATGLPILSVQPAVDSTGGPAAKVKLMGGSEELFRAVAYQIRKYNACRSCLACESVCRHGAISISADGYYIDPMRCVGCGMCITAKYIHGGCAMDKLLRLSNKEGRDIEVPRA